MRRLFEAGSPPPPPSRLCFTTLKAFSQSEPGLFLFSYTTVEPSILQDGASSKSGPPSSVGCYSKTSVVGLDCFGVPSAPSWTSGPQPSHWLYTKALPPSSSRVERCDAPKVYSEGGRPLHPYHSPRQQTTIRPSQLLCYPESTPDQGRWAEHRTEKGSATGWPMALEWCLPLYACTCQCAKHVDGQ